MFCGYCGFKNEDGAVFCGRCGKRLEGEENAAHSAPSPASPEQKPENVQMKQADSLPPKMTAGENCGASSSEDSGTDTRGEAEEEKRLSSSSDSFLYFPASSWRRSSMGISNLL